MGRDRRRRRRRSSAPGAASAVGPLVKDLETRLLAQQNPLFRASLRSLEGGPDTRAICAPRGRGARPAPTTATSSTCSAPSTRRRAATTTRPPSTARLLRTERHRRHRAQQPGQPGVRGGRVPGRHRALQAGDRVRARRPSGGDVLLQPLPGPPPALRVPAGAGGALAGGPPGQRPRPRLRQPLEVRQGRLRGGGPGPRRGRGVGEVRRARRGAVGRRTSPAGRGRGRAGRRCCPRSVQPLHAPSRCVALARRVAISRRWRGRARPSPCAA